MLYDRELTPAFQKKPFRFRQRETVAVLHRSFISRMMCSHVQKRFARHFLTNATTLASCLFVSIFFTPQFSYLYLGTLASCCSYAPLHSQGHVRMGFRRLR